MSRYHRLIEERGGRVLTNRTTVKGINVGDRFQFQGKGTIFKVLFFFKDRVFDTTPLIFGKADDGTTILMGVQFAQLLETKDKPVVKRRRR